ncbi:MAG: hypothetical protein ABI581_12835 [Sediminibacterium sp.]
MTNNPPIAKWTGLRHFIPAAFTGKPITETGLVFRSAGITQFLFYPFLWLLPRQACIYEIKLLLLSCNQWMKGNHHPLYPGCKLTYFTAIVPDAPAPAPDPYPRKNPFKERISIRQIICKKLNTQTYTSKNRSMKYLSTLVCLLVLALLSNPSFAQKTYIVNNAPSAVADYRTLQSAIDSVPAGSVLLLQPSAVAYEPATIRKRLAIYGSGYFLGQNAAPATQANPITSKVLYINFAKGSDGTTISGLQFTKNATTDHVHFDSTTNINISRCYFETQECGTQGCVPEQFTFNISSLITIQGCYIATANSHLTYNPESSSGILFQNNIIYGGNFGNVFTTVATSSVTMNHNTIITPNANFFIAGWNLINNIILKLSPNAADTTFTFSGNGGPSQAPSSASKNNVCNYSIFASATNKILPRNTTLDSLFITGSNSQSITSTDGFFILKSNTAAAGYANDNADCGAFGGTAAYVLSGIPAIPNIYFLQVTPNVTQSGGLKLSIKAKANN